MRYGYESGYVRYLYGIMSNSKNSHHLSSQSHLLLLINSYPYYYYSYSYSADSSLAKLPSPLFLQQRVPFALALSSSSPACPYLNRFGPEPLHSQPNNQSKNHNITNHQHHSHPLPPVRRRHRRRRRREPKSFQWRRKLIRPRKSGKPP